MKLWKNLLNDVLEQVFAGTLARPSSNWILLLHLFPHQQSLHLGVRKGKDKDGKTLTALL